MEVGSAREDDGLRAWRIATAALALTETVAVAAILILLFAFEAEYTAWSYLAAGVLVGLGVTQLLLVREARRRNPWYRPEEIYALLPLDRAHRNLVRLNLFAVVVFLPFLAVVATTMLDVDVFPTVFVLLVAGLSGLRPLLRAWRYNSWLAVSGLPERPRGDLAHRRTG